jgi:hypothetical protein
MVWRLFVAERGKPCPYMVWRLFSADSHEGCPYMVWKTGVRGDPDYPVLCGQG